MKSPKLQLTIMREAAVNLRNIHAYSKRIWEENTARKYMAEIYAILKRISENPSIGKIYADRATPFLMVAAAKHFVIYDVGENDVFVITVVHQARDVEKIITTIENKYLREIAMLKEMRKTRKR